LDAEVDESAVRILIILGGTLPDVPPGFAATCQRRRHHSPRRQDGSHSRSSASATWWRFSVDVSLLRGSAGQDAEPQSQAFKNW